MTVLRVARQAFLCSARTDSPYSMLAFCIGTLGALALCGTWIANSTAPRRGALSLSYYYSADQFAQRSTLVFLVLVLGLIAVAIVCGPLAAGSTFNRGRDARAVESLLLTGIRPLEIVGGKFLAALSRVLFVQASALPLLSVAWLYGGPPTTLIAIGLSIVVVIAALSTAVGLATAIVVHNNVSAILLAYVILACLVFAAPIAYVATTAASGQIDWARVLRIIIAVATPRSTPFSSSIGYRDLDASPSAIGGFDYLWLTAAMFGHLAVSGLVFLLSSASLDPYHPLRRIRVIRWIQR